MGSQSKPKNYIGQKNQLKQSTPYKVIHGESQLLKPLKSTQKQRKSVPHNQAIQPKQRSSSESSSTSSCSFSMTREIQTSNKQELSSKPHQKLDSKQLKKIQVLESGWNGHTKYPKSINQRIKKSRRNIQSVLEECKTGSGSEKYISQSSFQQNEVESTEGWSKHFVNLANSKKHLSNKLEGWSSGENYLIMNNRNE